LKEPSPQSDEVQDAELTPVAPPEKVRVAWVAGQESIETHGRTLKPLAIGLIDELVELTVACPQEADLRGLPSPPVEVIPHGRLGWWKFSAGPIEALAGQLKARKVQLLHALDGLAASLTQKLADLLAVPYVISSYDLGDTRRLGMLDERLSAILAASEPVRASLLSHHVAAAGKVRLVRPGVYHERRATCFLSPQHRPAIVANGRLNHAPAFEAVLQSFATLRGRGHDCALFIIGSGRAERHLRAMSEQLDIRQDVTFVDRQPTAQLPDVFKAADVFVSPAAEREVDGAALLAMAAGVPVLATDDQPSDFLIDGQTALLFEQGSTRQLTEKLMELLDNRGEARALAERALAYVEEHHSTADMVAAVTRVYRGAIDKKA